MAKELLQKIALSTQKAKTAFVGESPFSDLHTAEVMTDPVQLGHGHVRVKLSAALRGPGLDVNSFGSVLDVHQVHFNQPGLNKPHSTVCISGCGNILHREGVPQSSSRGQLKEERKKGRERGRKRKGKNKGKKEKREKRKTEKKKKNKKRGKQKRGKKRKNKGRREGRREKKEEK